MKHFGIVGLGFIADKHIQAIKNVGGKIVVGCDIDKTKAHKIGKAEFFTDYKKIINSQAFQEDKLDCISICTPNYTHFEIARFFTNIGVPVLIEKPMVIKLDDMNELEINEDLINNVVQLRYNPEIQKLKESIRKDKRYEVSFAVGVHRDAWYFDSWKNDINKSGGLLFNIGVHYFDLLVYLFGKPLSGNITSKEKGAQSGIIKFNNADAKWELSVNQPIDNQYRYLRIDGKEVNLSQNFENLHTRTYEEIIKGDGIRISDIKETIKFLCKNYGE